MDSKLSKYYEFILNLDFGELVKQSDLVEQENDLTQQKTTPQNVPLDFMDESEYLSIWEPLFFEETKANIVKAFQTDPSPDIECQITKINDGEFQTVELSMIGPKELPKMRDLVLFSTVSYSNGVPSVLGLVEHIQSEMVKIAVQINMVFKQAIFENVKNKRPFSLRKLTGISTLEREYKALHKFGELQLKQPILSWNSRQLHHSYFNIPEMLDQRLKKKYNQSQYDAIRQTLKNQGITLIQGPPGTGKTKTVIGTLSVLLSSLAQDRAKEKYQVSSAMEVETEDYRRSPWLKPGYDDWRDHIFDDVQEDLNRFFNFKQYEKDANALTMIPNDVAAAKAPEKILVCGPSNASVDEIIKKVLDEGLLDEFGQQKPQMIVRIGDNYDSTLHHISLEGLVQQRMFEQKLKDDDLGKIRKAILSQAKIVFGTLSSAGSNVLQMSEQVFDTVIIDEAAQAVEISTLIPLQYGCRRLILIGDHNQLPATVFSKICEKHKYDQSLFERLEKQGAPLHMLKSQYRMHPSISSFISQTFYKGELQDSENLMELVGSPSIYNYYTYSPLVVIHVRGYEQFVRNSFMNLEEAKLIRLLVEDLQKKFPKFPMGTLGIISAYSSQIWQIQQQLKQLGSDLGIEVKTVDGFQGREKDIIIFSTVRSKLIGENQKNPNKGIGFLSDVRRMNVSLSRCRQCLIVVCDIYKISCNPQWRGLVEYAVKQGTCYKAWTNDLDGWFTEFDGNPLRFQITELKGKQKNQGADQQ